MLIDWFTVGAQIVNFLVLMALLKIFLYDRVIAAMDAREGKIAERLDEADRQRQAAEEDRKEAAEQRQGFQEKREALLAKAREAARSKREELEDQARSEVGDLKERWMENLRHQKERLARDLRTLAVHSAMTVARRVVADMADDDFQARLVGTFAARLRGLDEDAKRALKNSLDHAQPTARILSETPLSKAQRQKITRLLHEEIHADLEVDYQEQRDLLGGIELRVPGEKVAWHPRQYLEDLEAQALQVITAAARDRRQAPAKKDEKRPTEANNGR